MSTSKRVFVALHSDVYSESATNGSSSEGFDLDLGGLSELALARGRPGGAAGAKYQFEFTSDTADSSDS